MNTAWQKRKGPPGGMAHTDTYWFTPESSLSSLNLHGLIVATFSRFALKLLVLRISLCNLRVLCVSVVCFAGEFIEHREHRCCTEKSVLWSFRIVCSLANLLSTCQAKPLPSPKFSKPNHSRSFISNPNAKALPSCASTALISAPLPVGCTCTTP